MIEINNETALAKYLADKKSEATGITDISIGTPTSAVDSDFSITINYIRAQNSGEDVCVGIELCNRCLNMSEKRKYLLLIEQYARLDLHRGEISKEKLSEIEEAAQLSSALIKGASILGYGANSGQALKQKLRQRGFSGAIADEAVEMLTRKGYVQEEEDARREAERSLAKGWGERRIHTYLRQRGYDTPAIESAMAALGDVDFVEQCAIMAKKKFPIPPADLKEKQKLIAFLVRYGYTMEEIREAMRQAWAE